MNGYHRDGCCVVRGGFDAEEIEAWRVECDRLARLQPGLQSRGRVVASPDREDRIDPVIDLSPLLASLAADDRVCRVAAAAVGGPVTLLKDKLILKPPGAPGYLPHQDFAYWQWLAVPAGDLVTVAVSIDGSEARSGAVRCAAGRHHRLLSADGVVGDFDPAILRDVPTAEMPTAPGDLLVLHPLVPHWSAENRSSAPRRMLFLTYLSARHGHQREAYYAALSARFEEAHDPTAHTIAR
jgi:ectoine hydroxylase-related dioxygenase (phytanoyl-CoA dioxygenase family)